MLYSLVSRSYTKLAPFLFSTSITLLIVFAAFEDARRTREAMKNLVNSIEVLAGQLNRLDEVPTQINCAIL